MEFCRLCDLETKPGSYESIFNAHIDPPISRMIANLANITILEDDPYTKFVCFQCFDQLQKFHVFRTMALYTDWRIRHIRSNINNNNDNDTESSCPLVKTEDADEAINMEHYPLKIENEEDHFSDDDIDNKVIDNHGVIDNRDETNTIKELKNCLNTTGGNGDTAIGGECFNDRKLTKPKKTSTERTRAFRERQRRARGYQRKIPKTGQQRSKEFRDRQKALKNGGVLTLPTIPAMVDNIDNATCPSTIRPENETNQDINGRYCIDNGQDTVNYVESMNLDERSIQSETLQNSNATNNKNNQYQCEICSKTFARKDTLKGHFKLHTGLREFHPCNMCGYQFQSKRCLERHLRSNKTIQHQCEICDKTFPARCIYRLHLKEHSQQSTDNNAKAQPNERRYKCNDCPMAFRFHSRFLRHSRTHSGKKPFKCNMCDKDFASNDSVKIHIGRVHIKSHECKICKQTFKNLLILRTHSKEHSKK